ncbi:uncharacterized protein BP5553_07642 [Venustampulla echinocandica]|uniref:Uncharacterized protein n=1 Tax=Venustampulla echinocandica TaxID=2656787 RepID=A0A370TH36_9HELO|nr:uncharacterized protein BP5553_07642 [Venustampulla echinocandica]RDL34514.1 hypothetical protein BP5553_07642 [Venustampulla echinocandica]
MPPYRADTMGVAGLLKSFHHPDPAPYPPSLTPDILTSTPLAPNNFTADPEPYLGYEPPWLPGGIMGGAVFLITYLFCCKRIPRNARRRARRERNTEERRMVLDNSFRLPWYL